MLKQCDDVEERSVESNGVHLYDAMYTVHDTRYTIHGTRYTVHDTPFTVHIVHRTSYIVLCDYFHLPVAPRPPMNLWR